MRVLVVEDEPALSSYLVPLLEREGYEAEAVDNGAEAVSRVLDRRPDLVLLDVGLPVLTECLPNSEHRSPPRRPGPAERREPLTRGIDPNTLHSIIQILYN